MNYNLLKTFVKVAEFGSFTQAATFLKQPKSRVSRAISSLESELGVELIRRTTRKTSLTSVGQDFYENITPHLHEIQSELVRVSDAQEEMSGSIRITTSDSFAQTSLTQIIAEYNLLYPNVTFEMIITNEYVDLIKDNIDLAFRAGRLKDSTLVQRKFMSTCFILVCSKAYADLNSIPQKLESLNQYKYLSFKPIEKSFTKNFNLHPILSTDSFPMLLKMVLSGSGISVLPDFLCQKYLDSGELVRVVPGWKSKSENVHILYPPSKNQPKRVKEFIRIARQLYTK